VSIEEVRSLVAERQRYDDWLTALEARRGETPARVYERVHGDYDARRTEVLTRLREHVGTLEGMSGDLARQVQDVSVRLDALEDQRVEAMIRNAVGEYDNDRWESLRHEVESEITKLTDDRALVQMELEEIRELLEQARPPQEPEPEPIAEPIVEPVAEPVGTLEGSPHLLIDDTSSVTAIALGSDVTVEPVDLLLETPLEPQAGAASEPDAVPMDAPQESARPVAAAPVLAPPAPPTMPQFGGEEVDDALAMFAETPIQPMAAVPAPLEGIDVEFDVADTDVLPVSTQGRAPEAGGVMPPVDPFDDLAFLRSVIEPSGSQPVVPATMTPPSLPSAQAPQGEQAKTLRCTECGTMNLPTEWYCERCGGELAAF
jgi:hypothetical protein